MRSLFRFLFLLLFLLISSLRAAEPFEILEGDRVLLLGDTLLERENTFGYLETRMHEQFPDRHFTVRNLSWAGDTPRGVSRASFDGPDKGWERLKESIAMVKPTVVFLGYGMAASLQEMTDRSQDITLNRDETRYGAEPYSVTRFKKEMGELMAAIASRAGAPPAEVRPGASPGRAGERAPATAGGAPAGLPTGGAPALLPIRFVLLSPIRHEDLREELPETDSARGVAARPGLPDPAEHNKLLEQYRKAVDEVAIERGATFVDLAKVIETEMETGAGTETKRVRMTDNGIHLSIYGYSSMQIALGERLGWTFKPADNATYALRAAVLKKNELFFHRFRPENATYLFGFRKHEQGQNAKEIPMFDPLIEQAEAEIDRLKKGGAAPKVEPPKSDNALANAERPPLPDFTVQDGYQITLWAENPLLEKPTQMNWDAQGRLWVCSSSLYPQIAPGQPANDKILILEDTDRDGKADKSTVFADGLLIPTAVVPDLVNTGKRIPETGKNPDSAPTGNLSGILYPVSAISPSACYVGQSTELLHFTDTNGDGKADSKRVVFSGFGTEDTHHIIHTLRWGPDGRLYFNQSIYIHSHLETPWGLVRLNSAGVFAYDPRTERVEVLFKGLCNPWGHAWDQWGQSFMTDGAGGGGINWAVPGAMYFTYENGRRIMPSISPGSYPKFCALELVHSPMFPDDWQGNAITNDFRAHRIVRFSIEDLATGPDPKSGYVTKEQPDLVRTNDQSFRPIDVRLGPDGALYIADWSNPVINHGEVDFRDPRRDHHMGRIWRISKKDAPPVKWEPLLGKTNAELLEKLLSKSAWEQEGARRVLVTRAQNPATSFEQTLDNWIGSNGVWGEMKVGVSPGLFLVAARNLARSTAFSDSSLKLLPTLDEPNARAAIARDLPRLDVSVQQKLARDPAPRVRLEAMRALSRIPTAESAALVLEAALNSPGESGALKTARAEEKGGQFDKPAFSDTKDPYYGYAAWLSINDLAKPWTEAIASGTWKADTAERAKQLEWGLKAIDPALAGATLSRLVTENKVPLDGTGPWIELLGQAGGPKELRRLLDKLGSLRQLSIADETRVLTALAEAARLRNVRPDGDLDEIRTTNAPTLSTPANRAAYIRVLGLWKLDRAADLIATTAGDTASAPEVRAAAFDGLRLLEKKDTLSTLTAADRPLDIRRAALVALAQLDINAAVTKAADVLPAIADENAALETWRGLVGIKGAADAFAAKLPATLPKPVATAGLRAAREAGKNGAKLLAALTPLAGMTDAEAKMPKDFKALAGFAKQNGDPARGEIIYRRAALGCTVCHAIGGAGGKVGPDMTSIGASAPLDYIIESTLAPAVKVKEGYNAVTLALKDGTQATGIQARETAQEVFLRDVVGKEQAIAKAQITGTTNVGSIMPAGMTDTLKDRERLDLFAFLGELGKPGPYDASKGTVARVWRLFSGADAPKVISGESQLDTAFPGYTLVDGRFVKELLAATAPFVTNGADTLMAVTQFQATGGKTRLKITGAGKVWLDGKPLALADDLAPELTAGVHTLAVKLDMRTFPEYLRAESPDARFLGNQ